MTERITKIEVWSFTPGFKDGPYVMSHVTQENARGRILRVQTANGLQGLGEVVFAPSLPPEAVQARIADEPDTLGPLIGQGCEALAALVADLGARDKTWRGFAFGLDTALYDLRARSQGHPLAAHLGGRTADSVDDYLSISEPTGDRVRRRLTTAGADRAVIQLKVGIDAPEEDLAFITATLAAMDDRQTLLADANGAWSRAQAARMMAGLSDPRLTWEEPCRSYDDNAALAERTGQRIMVDQCVSDPAAAEAALADGVVAAVCIKPAFLGGLTPARRIRDLAEDAGMALRIDGPWCGDIATAAILHLALGAPSGLLVAGCDLREPLAIAPDLGGVVAAGPGRIAPAPGPGLGIDLRGRLGAPATVYG